MTESDTQDCFECGLPSRTSILVAAVRAFGSRDPDESVRNPDWLADRLIGQPELGLINEHPVSRGLMQNYAEASQNPGLVLFAGLMLLRTRFIDEALKRAVTNGALQVVILGAGFDTRAYRFRELLNRCRVMEVDSAATQAYKKRRVKQVQCELPANLTYCAVDLAKDNLMDALRSAGFNECEKAFFVWEGVCMYLAEGTVRDTLLTVALHSAPGSTLVLDYANRLGIELGKFTQNNPGGIPAAWGEPWIFGVPDNNGTEFFRELGFDPGAPLSTSDPQVIQRYATRKDGRTYAAHVLEGLKAQAQTRPQVLPPGLLDARKAISAAGGTYWLAELTVSGKSVAR